MHHLGVREHLESLDAVASSKQVACLSAVLLMTGASESLRPFWMACEYMAPAMSGGIAVTTQVCLCSCHRGDLGICGGKQEIEEGENDSYAFGAAAMQGWRAEMVRPVPAAAAALIAAYAPLPSLRRGR